MENVINFYYGLNVIDYKNYDYYYLISTGDDEYLFNEIIDEDEIKNNINYLNGTDVLYHLLVLTKDNNMFIEYDNKKYGLFKVRGCNNYNIFSFSNMIVNGKCNWGKLWSSRVDYYLEQMNEVVDVPLVKYVMDYYISLAEIAISYFNNLVNYYGDKSFVFCLSHHIINSPLDSYSFFSPVNMCFDLCVRDVAEYIKFSFFDDCLTVDEILDLIDKVYLNDCLANFLLVRLIYPSYLFRVYDNYIENKIIDNKFYIYMNKSKEYEKLLSIIYNKLKLNYDIRSYIYFFKDLR